jgi:FkbM family methyltransferase
MTFQRALLRVLSSRPAGQAGRSLLRRKTWRIESGVGAGLKVRVRTNLDYIHGTSEIPVQQALADHLAQGGVFYDIGANTGFFSLIAANIVGPKGAVYAFEPVPENADVLRRNATLNRFGHLELFPVAVADKSGEAEIFVSEWDGGAALASSPVSSPDLCGSKRVTVVTLDEFIRARQLRIPSVIKIDVEGVELSVLHGMRETIKDHKPVLMCEIDDGKRDAFQRRWLEMDDYIQKLGYTIIHLESSYPRIDWNVGHSLALPSELAK